MSRRNGIMGLMNNVDPFKVAGADLRPFVDDWVAHLESGGGQTRGLLKHAESAPQINERYEYGARYMFANIGPRASMQSATQEELLLFAALAVYQDAGFPGADRTLWEGEEIHVRRAFAYFHEVGEQEAARRLRADVIRRSLRERPRELKGLLQNSMINDPAREASHDQEMASIDSRSFRAAELLDPDADFDGELAGWSS